MPTEPRTIHDLVDWGTTRMRAAGVFFGHGTDNAFDESVRLLAYALGLAADVSRDIAQRAVSSKEIQRFQKLVRRRVVERIPAAYLIGEAWFAGLPLTIDARVAIPRSPIAELIEDGFAPWYVDHSQPILDLCTGSGCIAIAAAHYLPDASVDATDISAAAVELTLANVRRHGLLERVAVRQGDLFAGFERRRYGLIVANPPYVGAHEMAALPAEYGHEPREALASGEDGLDLPVRILAGAAERLLDGGTLIMEVGNSEEALTRTFPRVPFLWLEFQRGGEGVLVVSRDDLTGHDVAIREELTRRGLT